MLNTQNKAQLGTVVSMPQSVEDQKTKSKAALDQAKVLLAEKQAELAAAAAQTIVPEVTATPVEEVPEYSKKELDVILNGLLYDGYATHSFKLKDIKVVLRTRFDWEEQEMITRIDRGNYELMATNQNEWGRLILAASLLQYNNFVFDPINGGTHQELVENFNERYDFVKSLNNVLTGLVSSELTKFDGMQAYILKHSDSVISNF